MRSQTKQPIAVIFKIAVIAVILAAGWVAVFNIPETVESFLPVVETVTMTPTEYHQTVSGTGVIVQKPNGWFVTVAVGESDIRRVQVGQSANISGPAFDDGIYTATVYEIDSVATRRQAEFVHETVVEVVLQLDNPDSELRTGYSARADIKTAEARDIFIIPYSVILQDDAGEFVFVLSGNSAVRRDILTGAELSQGAEVLAGLSEDDQIIACPKSVTENALVTTEDEDCEDNTEEE